MSGQWWALLNGRDFCVGQIVLPAGVTRPKPRDAAVKFKRAVRIERRGDLMTENIIVDRAAGTGTWEPHAPSVEAVATEARFAGMTLAQYDREIVQPLRDQLAAARGDAAPAAAMRK